MIPLGNLCSIVRRWWQDIRAVYGNARAMQHRLCRLQHRVSQLERGMDRLQAQVNHNALASTERHCDHDQRLRTLEVVARIEGQDRAPLDLGNDEREPPTRRSREN